MLELSIAGVVLASLAAAVNWQKGIFLAVVVAFLQDPIRKIIPGQPTYFILFTGIVFGAAMIGALAKRVPLEPSMVIGWRRYLGPPFQFFVVIVVLQAFHSLIIYGNPFVPLLGLISYLTPFVALALAHAFAATGGTRRIHAFLLVYAVCAAIGLLTVYLESSGFKLAIFGEVGVGILLYDKVVGMLNANSGIFRASEIAAWHAATCACVIMLIMTYRQVSILRVIIALAIVALVVGIGILTGRRKFLVMIAIFGSAYVGLLGLYWGRIRSVTVPAVILAIAGYWLIGFQFEPDVRVPDEQEYSDEQMVERVFKQKEYDSYVARTSSVFGEVGVRFVGLGLAPIMWAYDQYGLLGGGAGIGTQGVGSVMQERIGSGAAEGGLGKIMVELGVPGLLAVIILGVAFFRHILRLLREVAKQSTPHLRLACGFAALLIANLASFSVATQAFGDIFILLFLGFCLGALLAIPRIVAREVQPRPVRRSVDNLPLNVRPQTRVVLR